MFTGYTACERPSTLCLMYDNQQLSGTLTASVPVHTSDNVEFVACAMWELAIDVVESSFDDKRT